MIDDLSLKADVEEELEWEPSLDASDIGVGVEDGVVTLMGHVPSFIEKVTAEQTVRRVNGVRAIALEIEVRLPGGEQTADDEIAKKAADMLDWDVSVPSETLQVTVQNGYVSLSGEVDWNYQRAAAEARVAALSGVLGISNQIEVKARPAPDDIKGMIEKALLRRAKTEASNIQVSVRKGRVILDGKVDAWRDRTIAEQAAWSAPGVVAVEDNLRLS